MPTNPPAFPRTWVTGEGARDYRVWTAEGGMTLMDWFAGRALQGLLASGRGTTEGYAREAYQYARDMLEARLLACADQSQLGESRGPSSVVSA